MAHDHLGFRVCYRNIRNGVFLPRYYNPEINARLAELRKTHQLLPLGDLLRDGLVTVSVGNEIGKMAYGTGTIPFVRTSDISNWEIKADPKQGVSPEIYAEYATRQDVREGDILFNRDGTYLIGQSCFVTKADLPCLYQSHILKLRVASNAQVAPHLLFAALNAPITKKQIRSKQFTADIIDTIGDRYAELLLPIPRDTALCERIVKELREVLARRAAMREQIRRIPLHL